MALSSCAHQDTRCVFVQLYHSLRAGPKSAVGEKEGHFDRGEYALETKGREAHLEHGDDGEPWEGTGSG